MTTNNTVSNFNMSEYDDNADINAMLSEAGDYDYEYSYDSLVEEKTTSPVSSDKTENTTNLTVNTTTNSNTMTTSNVSAIVNYGKPANVAINFDGVGTSIASLFANSIYSYKKAAILGLDTAEEIAAKEAKVSIFNNKVDADRLAFVAKYDNVLGFLAPVKLVFDHDSVFAKSKSKAKKEVQNLFDANAQTTVDVSDADPALLVFSLVAAATSRLTGEQRAELVGGLGGCSVKGATVYKNGITVDLSAGTITRGFYVQSANIASCFGSVGKNDFVVLDGIQTVFMFALQTLGGTRNEDQTKGDILNAVSIFVKDHNYGHRPDTDDISFFVRANQILTSKIVSGNDSFPVSFSIRNAKQHPDFLSYVLGRGVIATSDKQNGKFVTINEGAEATGLGWNRETNTMMTVNDVNKPSKLINRGAANNYDCADQTTRVASNFGFALSNGQVARTKGRMMKTAYTNSVLMTAGSGVGIINPNTFFEYTVDKKLIFPMQFSLVGASYINNTAAQSEFIEGFLKSLEIKKGQVFAPGATIATANGTVVIANTEVCSSVEFVGASISYNVLDKNEINIVAFVRLQGKSQFVKTRRFATKFTTTPYKVEGLSQEWEIILNNECTKGQGALLEMFANETGERFVNNNTGEFVTPGGDVINLLDKENAFQTWKENSTRKEVITLVIAKSVYENIKDFAPSELTVIAETESTVTVQETVSVIFGSLVYDVEISTPLESVSRSSLTLESASAVYLQSEKLGTKLFNDVNAKSAKFAELANFFNI